MDTHARGRKDSVHPRARMLWILLGLLFVFILFIASQEDLPDKEEDGLLLYHDEEDELLEDEILLYYDEEDEGLLDDEDEEV